MLWHFSQAEAWCIRLNGTFHSIERGWMNHWLFSTKSAFAKYPFDLVTTGDRNSKTIFLISSLSKFKSASQSMKVHSGIADAKLLCGITVHSFFFFLSTKGLPFISISSIQLSVIYSFTWKWLIVQ